MKCMKKNCEGYLELTELGYNELYAECQECGTRYQVLSMEITDAIEIEEDGD